MNVTELIELTNRLSTDKSELTPKERAAYLQYLNMANDELYEIASSGYAPITNRKDLFPAFESPFYKGTTAFNYPDNFFKIDSVFADHTLLKRGNIKDMASGSNVGEYLTSHKYIYVDNKNKFLTAVDPTDGVTKKYITLFYAELPKRLVEDINDANLETNTPVYPLPYHIFLVHGALYYFYFSNKVFMDKMAYIRNVWENDKKILANFKNYGL
jgi:hypothetical protein